MGQGCISSTVAEQVVEKLSAIAAVHASVEQVLDTEAQPLGLAHPFNLFNPSSAAFHGRTWMKKTSAS